jgi:formylglycine-generating enzyme required for sulfatase activity
MKCSPLFAALCLAAAPALSPVHAAAPDKAAARATAEEAKRAAAKAEGAKRAAAQAEKKARQLAEWAKGIVPSEPDFDALRLAVEDLAATFGDRYPGAQGWLGRLGAMEAKYEAADAAARKAMEPEFRALQSEALLANPLLAFGKILLIRREAPPSEGLNGGRMGLPQNWQGNCALPRQGVVNEIATLSPLRPDGALTTIYRPAKPVVLADIDLHTDGERMLFCMPAGSNNSWQVFEMRADGTSLRQVTQGFPPDVDNYDPCYLPHGDILFASTACIAGVPCVGGGSRVANMFRSAADGSAARQLTFDQEHNWCPTMMEDGRILYSRWEYTDTPHYFSRLLFAMNPDGTAQRAVYGSNSWWPNSTFYARPIPGQPNRLVAVISGHHGVARMGELLLFDLNRGQYEAEGVMQRIPGRGRPVEPIIVDGLVNASWPKFVHPFPLAEEGTHAGAGRYFLVSMKPDPGRPWGIYLVDVFDNLVLVREDPAAALFEPVPLVASRPAPAIPDRVDLSKHDALVYLSDVYTGEAMRGVPRGTVKSLRLFAYHYAYPGTGGHIHIGIDGPWDARRILGTVPVEPDGSAAFVAPANTPIACQPLDAQGRAVQVMRSWFTAMPGETLSCVGCHEKNYEAPPSTTAAAFRRAPSAITPWRGPARPFSFQREVQPVLDRRCAGCHDGSKPGLPDFRADGGGQFRNFMPSYVALHPYVNRPGPESDYRVRPPMEYHAETSELMQRLRKGHHGVELDAEDWDRLITWIDLNVPDHGTWAEQGKLNPKFAAQRVEMRKTYANRAEDYEVYPSDPPAKPAFVAPAKVAAPPPADVRLDGWPFDAAEAARRQAGGTRAFAIDLAPGIRLDMVRIPAGSFVMGSEEGFADERPRAAVKIDRDFWMSHVEISNAAYELFDPAHDSGAISQYNKDHNHPGQPADRPTQPAIFVSWTRATEFCRWLSARTGRTFSLPTEAQWEYACRAGTGTPMHYGAVDADFSKLANLADRRISELTFRDSPKWIPRIESVDDGAIVTENPGRYPANAWGLQDMHGNAAEWTRSLYRPLPWRDDDGRNDEAADGLRVVRGGSYWDRPVLARSSARLALEPWGRYRTVGFRVVCEDPPAPATAAR